MEASEGAFDYDFLSCRSLIINLFSDLDLSKITMEAALATVVEATSKTTSGIHIMELPTTPSIEVLLTEVPTSPTEVPITEVALT